MSFDYEKYGVPGEKIPNSRCKRGYCPECGEPVRLVYNHPTNSMPCIDCDPPHIGCSSPPSPNDNEDEYSSSWRIATGT